MGDYIDLTDIETYLGKTFSSSTTPTSTQMTEFITIGEEDFEQDVGDFTSQTVSNEIVDGHYFGVYVSKLPLTAITTLEERSGTLFDPTYTTISSDNYLIKNSNIGKIYLATPIIGQRQYRVTYTAGYAKASMPERLKFLVMLYVLRHAFQQTLFNTNGEVGGTQEIIDVEVYREITNSGNPFNGLVALDQVIHQAKQKWLRSIKTYVQ